MLAVMRAWPACLAVVLGCGAPSAPAAETPTSQTGAAPGPVPTSPAAEASPSEPAPSVAASPTLGAGGADSAPSAIAEGATLAWPEEPVASFTHVLLDIGGPMELLAAQDGKPLVVIGREHFLVVPTDGRSPVRVYANERGLSPGCMGDHRAAIAGGAFLTCARDDTLVARDLETLEVRWERSFPGPRETLGEGDTFLVRTSAGWTGLDAASGATRWERPTTSMTSAIATAGLAIVIEQDRLDARDVRTGEPRFEAAYAGEVVRPLPGGGIVLAPTGTAPALRLIAPDGTERTLPLDAPSAESIAALFDDEALTAVVQLAARRMEVRRYDLASEARTARSETFDSAGFPRVYALGRDLLLVSPLGGRLLDAEDLTQRWLGEDVGECRTLVPWRPTTQAAPALACLDDEGTLSVFVASATQVTRHRVRVSGSTRCGGGPSPSIVWIEGRTVESRSDGRYRVDVMADDDIDISATALDTPMDTACTGGRRSVPVPAGASAMHVDVAMTWLSFDISGL